MDGAIHASAALTLSLKDMIRGTNASHDLISVAFLIQDSTMGALEAERNLSVSSAAHRESCGVGPTTRRCVITP